MPSRTPVRSEAVQNGGATFISHSSLFETRFLDSMAFESDCAKLATRCTSGKRRLFHATRLSGKSDSLQQNGGLEY